MNSIYEVAKWFLSKQSMTHKKLQKMCYYAQAWHCALLNRPLFEEEIQAWVHGPVAPALYPVYADYGWNKIPMREFDGSCFAEDTVQILDAVFDTYSDFSGDQLESLTHSEDPWINARGNLKPWKNCNTPISTTDMHHYYKKNYEESQND